jgi:Helicase conserved C-terminal domain
VQPGAGSGRRPRVKTALRSRVKPRVTTKLDFTPSPQEETLYDALAALDLREDRGPKKGQRLFKTTLEKALFSSPAAFIETVRHRIETLRKHDDEASRTDVAALSALLPFAEAIDEQAFAKYQQFLKLLRDDLKWKPSRKDDRIVVFSERIATIDWLAARLRADLGLSEEQARTLHGSGEGADLKVQQIVADFGIEKKPIRILLASDLASEGLNLHYLSHKLIHFDISWAPLKFQQRNGRIDRCGQEREPHVWYLVGHPKQEKIRGDLRILERLVERDNAARENIGDPSVFMGTNDEERQEDVVAEAIEAGESAEKFDADMDARANAAELTDDEQFAAIEAFFGAAQPEAPAFAENVAATARESRPTAFGTCFDFVAAALGCLKQRKKDLRFDLDIDDRVLTLDIPIEFRERTSLGAAARALQPRFMPPEAEPDDGRIRLTDNRGLMNDSIRRSRLGTENGWPQYQYLWDVHPIVDWLADRVSSAFGRGSAPVTRLRRLEPDEAAFVFNGVVPNLKGHPLVDEWPVILFKDRVFQGVEPAPAFLARAGVGAGALPNVGDAETDDLVPLIEEAVHRAQDSVSEARKRFDDKMTDELLALDEKRQALLAKHQRRIDGLFDGIEDHARTRTRRDRERQRVEDEFKQWWEWITQTR